jgi:hypothetical protein
LLQAAGFCYKDSKALRLECTKRDFLIAKSFSAVNLDFSCRPAPRPNIPDSLLQSLTKQISHQNQLLLSKLKKENGPVVRLNTALFAQEFRSEFLLPVSCTLNPFLDLVHEYLGQLHSLLFFF